jgi:hypothetical protein
MTDIRLEETETGGRYFVQEETKDQPEMTFSRANPQLIIVDHTYVPEHDRGKGIAGALVDRLIADAREKNFKIIPLCPYVKRKFQEHPEWADVLSG